VKTWESIRISKPQDLEKLKKYQAKVLDKLKNNQAARPGKAQDLLSERPEKLANKKTQKLKITKLSKLRTKV